MTDVLALSALAACDGEHIGHRLGESKAAMMSVC